MATILHISDLHFGAKFHAPNDQFFRNNKGAETLADTLYDTIELELQAIGQSKIDVIVISGDIADLPSAANYEHAQTFIKHLMTKLSILKENVLIVPGNHDVDYNSDNQENDARFAAFRNFYNSLLQSTWDPEEPNIITIEGKDNFKRIVFFGLNSTMIENPIFRGLGYINDSQFRQIEKWTHHNRNYVSEFRIAVLHHHVLPVHDYHPSSKEYMPEQLQGSSDRPLISVLLNSSELLEECNKLNINIILHGHSHAPFHASYTNYVDLMENSIRSVTVLGAGSIFSEDNISYGKKQFQIIEILGETSNPILHIHPIVNFN